MLSLNTTIELDFRKFWHWWMRELAALLPDKISQLLINQQDWVVVEMQHDGFRLLYQGNVQQEIIIPYQTTEKGFKSVLGTKAEQFLNAHWVIRLSADQALSQALTLPIAAADNIQQVMTYELDKYTPFKPEQVYFSAQIVEKNPVAGQVTVNLVVTPKDKLDGISEQLNTMGISPDLADCQQAANDLRQGYGFYNLLPASARNKPQRMPVVVNTVVVLAVLLLTLATAAVPVWQNNQTVDALRQRLHTLEKETRKVEGLQLEIDSLIEDTVNLIDKKNVAPSMIEVLNSLSAVIKEDTWLTSFRYRKGEVQIQGKSPAAAALIAILEASPVFSRVHFVSPVMQDKASGKERFKIAAELSVGARHD